MAVLLLVVFYITLMASLRGKSATFDEPGHATGGYIYWKYGDYRVDPENGNLSKRWMALPLLLRHDRFPGFDTDGWQSGNSWILADAWFNRLKNDTSAMLAAGRLMAGLVAVALGGLVWFWSRQLFGPLGGLVSLLLYVMSPIILANGGLMTSDIAATLGFVASLGGIWAVLHRITLFRVLGSTLAITGLFLAKMSAPLLLPMATILVVARLVDGRPLPIGRWMLTTRGRQAAMFAATAFVQTLGVVALVWAAYGFRFTAFSDLVPGERRFKDPWEWYFNYPEPPAVFKALQLTPDQKAEARKLTATWFITTTDWTHEAIAGLPELRSRILTEEQRTRLDALMRPPKSQVMLQVLQFSLKHRLLPEAFIVGYAHVWRSAGHTPTFLNGKVSEKGFRSFFPYVFSVKTPLPCFVLLALASGLAIVCWRQRQIQLRSARRALWPMLYAVLPLLSLFVFYWLVALASGLTIGHRHLLPIYPPLFILAGCIAWLSGPSAAGILRPGWCRGLAVAAGVLLAAHAAEIAYRYPNYIAYFNGIVSPDRAYRHVVDSSLDWGQELPAIAAFVQQHPEEKIHLAYFGVGEPANYGINSTFIGGMQALEWKRYRGITALKAQAKEQLVEFVRDHPAFDLDSVFSVKSQPDLFVALMKGSELRLEPGLYVLSATMLQPLYHGRVDGYYTAERHEQQFRAMSEEVQPFLGDNLEAKYAVISRRSFTAWQQLFQDYEDFRLGRLTAFLRAREPDYLINHGVLVYRLTAADVKQVLEGPLP